VRSDLRARVSKFSIDKWIEEDADLLLNISVWIDQFNNINYLLFIGAEGSYNTKSCKRKDSDIEEKKMRETRLLTLKSLEA